MQEYHALLRRILTEGTPKGDRTGTGTMSVFGHQMRFNLNAGFPLITTKRIPFRLIVHELLWFISGNTNIKYLTNNNVHIWDEWADDDGELGPVYGKQWRSWSKPQWEPGGLYDEPIDQLANAIKTIRTNPDSRRIIVSAWNPADIEDMALPPCHLLFQFFVNDGKLSCGMYQRSADSFLGVPFNIASYALLTHMVAQITGLMVGDLVISFGDVHLYMNHLDQAALQLSRPPLRPPRLILNPEVREINDFQFEDVQLSDYQAHDHIAAKVAV